jgi:hypothetical protein
VVADAHLQRRDQDRRLFLADALLPACCRLLGAQWSSAARHSLTPAQDSGKVRRPRSCWRKGVLMTSKDPHQGNGDSALLYSLLLFGAMLMIALQDVCVPIQGLCAIVLTPPAQLPDREGTSDGDVFTGRSRSPLQFQDALDLMNSRKAYVEVSRSARCGVDAMRTVSRSPSGPLAPRTEGVRCCRSAERPVSPAPPLTPRSLAGATAAPREL